MIYVGGVLAGVVLFGMMIMPARYYVTLVGIACAIGGGYWCISDKKRGIILLACGVVLTIIGLVIWRREHLREQAEAEQTAESIRNQMQRKPPGIL